MSGHTATTSEDKLLIFALSWTVGQYWLRRRDIYTDRKREKLTEEVQEAHPFPRG